jgi:hypothetical protein
MTVNHITDQLTQLVHRRVFNCYLVRGEPASRPKPRNRTYPLFMDKSL